MTDIAALRACAAAAAAKLNADKFGDKCTNVPALPPAKRRRHREQDDDPTIANGEATVLQIPQEVLPLVIGRKGEVIKGVEARHDVDIKVGNIVSDSLIRLCIIGSEKNRSQAKEAVEKTISEKYGTKLDNWKPGNFRRTVEVPERFLPKVIGKKGESIKRVKESYGVGAMMDRPCSDSGRELRNIVVRGNFDAVNKACEFLEKEILQCYRMFGIFNAPLEDKLANVLPALAGEESMQKALPAPTAQRANYGTDLHKSQASQDGDEMEDGEVEPANNNLLANTMHCPQATQEAAQHQVTEQQTSHTPGVIPLENTIPAIATDFIEAPLMLQWATRYAADPTCMSYYKLLLQEAANQGLVHAADVA